MGRWTDAGTYILLSPPFPGILGGMREKAMNFFIFLLIWRTSSHYCAFFKKNPPKPNQPTNQKTPQTNPPKNPEQNQF